MIRAYEYELTERRIDNCFIAAENTVDEHMKNMWRQKAMYLIRQLGNINREMYERSNRGI